MKKRIAALFTAAFTVLGLSIQHPAMAAAPQRYTPKSGGFTMTIPPGSTELYHTTTGVRFKVGEDFLISADLYTLPSFISVPMKQYSGEQKRELSKFLKKIQDDQDNTIVGMDDKATGQTTDKAALLRDKLHGKKNNPSAQLEKEMQAGCYDFRSVPKDPEKTRRPFIIGRAYQTQKNNLCVVTVRTTQANEEAGKEALKAITKDLDLKKIHYTDENILTVPNLGFQMEIPSGWRIYTLRADNVLFGRSLSSVHTDSMMIRRLSDDSFKELGSATKATINEAEKNFIEKITSYTPNITILHHEPIIVGDLRGSLSQSTDNEDLKKVFLLNAYLLNPQGEGYVIHFQTDDTINYDLKLSAFKRAVQSFTLLGQKKKST
ncbi:MULTISPECIES: hypothetical protein [Acidaminococcus]|uniref:hypothetical protein n=1 Tax=Acidaminococcus TaxID=904 RepID=UPI000E7172EF|nr:MULTISPECIES: hypothetical protein [Acidaminococcus]RJU38434.1 hypothetical protein DW817_03300 [Acidaminococcus sp. AM33-14BH]